MNPGDRLGPYEIVEAIGKGGMGEVYRARDPRLGRDVAIKVSAQRFSERFEREARAIASLNHPNICHLYDVGDNYLVMELIEGPTLAERIKDGAIPLEESLHVARQIADALEAAHEKGITHRDLKPGNVKVKLDGTVKVLDFGLAKVSHVEAGATGVDSPTISMHATQAGVILGTAAYMAPEQARGKPVDKRADIWAFGVVLYEMVTGKRLFQGEDLTETLASVVMKEPDLSDAPREVQRLLAKCLVKDPRKRLRDISGVELLLEEGRAEGPPQAASLPHGSKWVWPAVAAVLGIVAVVGWWALWRAAEPEDRPLVRLNVDLGPSVSLIDTPLAGQSIALTPDGSRLVYVAKAPDGPYRVYVQRLDQPGPVALPGTEGADRVFMSPDGQWVGFVAASKVGKISIEGGAVVPLMETQAFAGAAWGEDGSIIVSAAVMGGLFTVPEGGGKPAVLLPLGEGDLAFRGPQILPGGPGGRTILFTATQPGVGGDNTNLDVWLQADGVRKTVVPGGSSGLYLPSGHLVYNTRGTLFAVPFDLERLETRGTAVPVQAGLAYNPTTAFANLAFSRDGTLVYRTGGSESAPPATVQWLDSAGARRPLISTPGVFDSPRLSPDGRKLAIITSAQGSQRLNVYDPDRENMTPLTFGSGTIAGVVWTPDGRSVVFGERSLGISLARADGAGQPARIPHVRAPRYPSSFSPDGNHLAFVSLFGLEDIFTVPVTANGGQLSMGEPELFLRTANSEDRPRFSRDGRWLAYQSDESGRDEISVQAFPKPSSGEGAKISISNNGGERPVWSRTANVLYYQSSDRIMAVNYRVEGDVFVADRPRVWAELRGATFWDMGPDGRAVITAPAETPGAQKAPETDRHIVFLQNFFAELRRRAPGDGK